MANVILAARTMTTNILDTVSVTTTAVAAGAETLAAYAEDYRDQTKRDLAKSAVQRAIMKDSQRAEEISRYFMDLDDRLGKNKKLKAYYDKALEKLNQSETQAIAAE